MAWIWVSRKSGHGSIKKESQECRRLWKATQYTGFKNEQDRILEIHEEYKGKIKSDGNIIDIISLSDFPGYTMVYERGRYALRFIDHDGDGRYYLIVARIK